jgi:predicted RNase H-like nuclease
LRFIGCSLAWRPGEAGERPSCLVVLDERGSIVANSFATGAQEISAAVEDYGAERRGLVVGVDAPLSVPNERGTRRIERVLSRLALPAYSASRKMFGGESFAEELLAALEGVGVEYTDYPFRRARGQQTVTEVDSAATLKVLLFEGEGHDSDGGRDDDGDLAGVLRGLPEPKLRKGNKEGRAASLKNAVDVLWNTPGLRLRTGNLSAELSAEENVDLSKLDIDSSLTHAELDRVASLVEGTLAAYTVHRHWKGRDVSIVVGTGYEGFVLLPAAEALRGHIAEECRAAGVPYA